ncbi:protein PflB [Rodentibacter pneumotropicus]|uniref:Protein PflB n=1 Tax=Rodentibacter pneumotropicus TaxID=758 RepID=A0A3S4VGF4_9PAST|nr:protein PflB [Rodentibacter pneumotropicus]
MPFGGIKMVEGSCKVYGRELDPEVKKSLLNIVKPTTKGCLMFIRRIFYVAVNQVC